MRKLPHQVVEAFRSTLEVVCESDLVVHVVDGSAPDFEGQVDAVRTVLAEIGADGLPELLVVNKADAVAALGCEAGEEARRLLAAHPGSVMVSARTGAGIDQLLTTIGDRLRVGDLVVELDIPWARGDVLAAVHREGEIVGEVAGEQSTRIQVVLDEVGQVPFRRVPRFVTPDARPTGPPAGSPRRPTPTTGWRRLKAGPRSRFAGRGGLVDCSIGTPCDPPPAVVLEAMADSERRARLSGLGRVDGLPPGRGRLVARGASGCRSIPTTELAACVGTKEFVASIGPLPPPAQPRSATRCSTRRCPTRPTPWARSSAGCRAVPVPELSERRPRPGLRRRGRRSTGPDAVDQLAVQPDRLPHRPGRPGAGWGREHEVPVFSDECYTEFTWDGRPSTVLAAGCDGVVAVHSLSKRSNLAGVRAGFFAGDPELVGYLADVRRHAGLMVPGPVQAGAVVAFGDDVHVDEQRARYRERLNFLAGGLDGVGLPAPMPAGGFYLWVPVPERCRGSGGSWPNAWPSRPVCW